MFLQLNKRFPIFGVGMHGCQGGMHGCWGGAWLRGVCMVARGCAWLPGGMHGCGGACVVAGEGACVVARGCMWLPGGCMVARGHVWLLGGCVQCDLSHHAFDVTCMLPPHQLRLIPSAAAYIVFGHVTMHAPPVERMTDMCKNITFANYVCGR